MGIMTFMFSVGEARKLITWVSTRFGIHDGDPVEWVFTGNWRACVKQYLDDLVDALLRTAVDAVLLVASGGIPGLVKAVVDAIATMITVLVDGCRRERHLPRPPLEPRKLDELHHLVLRAAATAGNPVIAELAEELRSGRMTADEAAYSEALADGAVRLKQSAEYLRPIDIRTDVDDPVLRRTVSEMAIWVEQFEANRTAAPRRDRWTRHRQ